MSRKRKIDKPFDFGYNVMYNEYPKELHKVLNVPGIFRRKANEKVYFKDGSIGEMDSSYIIDPDSKTIFEPCWQRQTQNDKQVWNPADS